MRITYIINEYPKISHTFIRSEIQSLEKIGFVIQRIALRGWDTELVDSNDVSERDRTFYVMKSGVLKILVATAIRFLLSPCKFLKALRACIRISIDSPKSLFFHLAYLAEACLAMKVISRFNADHVHAHFGNNSTEVALLVRVLGGPQYSFTLHGQSELYAGGLMYKVSGAEFTVAISSYGRAQIFAAVHPHLWEKVLLIKCGLSENFLQHGVRRANLSNRFVCIGRFSPEKGHLVLLQAVKQLSDSGVDVSLCLVGDGELRPEIERFVRENRLERSVRLRGWLNQIETCSEIENSRALVLPSFQEGLPIVLMEAMAYFRPVIAPYVGGIPELVAPNFNGWLVPAADPGAMSAAIKECLNLDYSSLEALGRNAVLSIQRSHSAAVQARILGDAIVNSVSKNHLEVGELTRL